MLLQSGRKIGQKAGGKTTKQTTSEQRTEHTKDGAKKPKNGANRIQQVCAVTPLRTPDSFNLTLSHCCNPLDSRNLRQKETYFRFFASGSFEHNVRKVFFQGKPAVHMCS